MPFLYTLLIVLEAVVCLLLIGIVLLQKSTGDGNGLSFGGGAESVFGAQTGNVLTRGTVILAIIFLVNTLVLGCLGSHKIRSGAKSRADLIVEQEQKAAQMAEPAPLGSEADELLGGAAEAIPAPVEIAPAPAPVEAAAAPVEAAPAEPAPAPEAPAAPAAE